MEHRRDELDLLLVALGQLLGLPAPRGPRRGTGAATQSPRAARRPRARPGGPRRTRAGPAPASAGRARAPRGGSPNVERGRRWLSVPRQVTRPGVRLQDAERDPHRRRLAGAVRAEEPEHLARRDLEREVVERDDGAEALGQVVDDEGHPAASIPAATDRPLGEGPERSSGRRCQVGAARSTIGCVQDAADHPAPDRREARRGHRQHRMGRRPRRRATTRPRLRWLCPCAYCRGEAGMPGWLDTNPTLTADQTRLVDVALVGDVRDPADLGRRPPHGLPHLPSAARLVPLRRVPRDRASAEAHARRRIASHRGRQATGMEGIG